MLRICSLIVLMCMAAQAAVAQDFSGRARFVDADTVYVGSTKVRLFGIDAPEMAQPCKRSNGRQWACGQWASDQARALFDGKRAVCRKRDMDRYGRVVAVCRIRGIDIGDTLVRQGIAVAFTRYSLDYVPAEKEASVAGRGIWEGSFEQPAQYRAASRPVPSVPVAGATGCVIKGNISSSGRIFHVPGQEHYARTVISPSRGERWFCSQAEALAAGWRKARR